MITPVIMAGGSGARLWPLSRQMNPKQFLKLFGEETMLQQTLGRLESLPCSHTIVICNEEHRFLAAEQILQSRMEDVSIILEPVPKNTAPAITLAALHVVKRDENVLLLVLPADHVIADTKAFHDAVRDAIPPAEKGRLVTFGILPTRPETGYGYIRRGEERGRNIYDVVSFSEKPDEETALKYIESGSCYWNSGMFLFRARTYLDEVEKLAPDVYDACSRAMENTTTDLDFLRIDGKAFEESPAVSVDYSVMEKTDLASVVPLDAGWSDIGSWNAIWEIGEKDERDNSVTGDIKALSTENSLIMSENRLVVAVGVKDLVIVETKDAVLVAHKDSVQKIKDIVEDIKNNGRHEHLNQREVFRPWGSYDSLEKGPGFQVKHIIVKPGAKTSLQMHLHRAEHWVVICGSAKVTIDGKVLFLEENESTFIPIGRIHSLENPGELPLELIEIQSGNYLGEDDIVRFEDKYGRC